MLRCRASSLAAGGDKQEAVAAVGREGGRRGRRGNDKHEHGGSWGQLKIAQGRRGAKSDGGTAGRMVREAEAQFIFSCFENEMFRSWNRGEAERKKNERKKKRFYSRVPCSPPSNQTMAILGTAVFSKSRLDWLLTLLPLPSKDIPVWRTRSGKLHRPRLEGKRKNHCGGFSRRILICLNRFDGRVFLRRGKAAIISKRN